MRGEGKIVAADRVVGAKCQHVAERRGRRRIKAGDDERIAIGVKGAREQGFNVRSRSPVLVENSVEYIDCRRKVANESRDAGRPGTRHMLKEALSVLIIGADGNHVINVRCGDVVDRRRFT